MIIAIDFDGTIVEDRYPDIGELKPDAKEVINRLSERHHIIIWTCRRGEAIRAMYRFLDAAGVTFHAVNIPHPKNVEKHMGDTRKVFADVYIDDHNIGGLPSWTEIEKIISDKEARHE